MEKNHLEEPTSRIKGLLQRDKAAALGLAVLFATGALLGGCAAPNSQPGTAGWELVDEEEAANAAADYTADEDDVNYYYGGHGIGYFRYSGLPKFQPGGKVTWSKPADKLKPGGYGFMRGGSAAG